MPTLQCQTCGEPVTIGEPIPRDAECPSCHGDLRACRNCRHYDTAYNNSCRETMADPVEDKSRRNFCEYFYFNRATFQAKTTTNREADARRKLEGLFGGQAPATDKPQDARAKLDALFGGKKPNADRQSEARHRLDDLFSKPKAPDPDDDAT
jgi:predicted nucleotidyltransferase